MEELISSLASTWVTMEIRIFQEDLGSKVRMGLLRGLITPGRKAGFLAHGREKERQPLVMTFLKSLKHILMYSFCTRGPELGSREGLVPCHVGPRQSH